jgi:hypothetical protein
LAKEIIGKGSCPGGLENQPRRLSNDKPQGQVPRDSPFVAVPNPVPGCAKHKYFVYLPAAIAAILKKLSDSSRQLT